MSTSPNRVWALAHALYPELGVRRTDKRSDRCDCHMWRGLADEELHT